MHGVSRLDLSRLAKTGHLERLAHGVYKVSSVPSGPFDDLHAAWLSTEPQKMGEDRIKDRVNGVVVAGETAADLHGIGDFRALRHEFVAAARRQSQRHAIRYRQRCLEPQDVVLVEGLPTMTMERTIADLVDDSKDLSLVGNALSDASRKRTLDLDRLRELLAPLAARDGFKKGDGDALLQRLMEIAGIDLDALAARVARDKSLGSLVAAKYVSGLRKADLDLIIKSPEMDESLRALTESMTAVVQQALKPQLAELDAISRVAAADVLKTSGMAEALRRSAEQSISPQLMRALGQGWIRSANLKVPPMPKVPPVSSETLALARAAQRAVDGDS